MKARATHPVAALLILIGLATLAACGTDVQPAGVAPPCPTSTPKASTLAMVLAKGTPQSVTFCASANGDSTAPSKAVALDPVRTLQVLTTTATGPDLQPFYCPGPAPAGTAGLMFTYPTTQPQYVAISPGSCASLPEDNGAFNYLHKDDIEWLVRAAGLDWLGTDGVQETTPPPPTVCPTSPPKPTPLAPVLAKGVATKAVTCWYNFEDPETVKPGVVELPLDPATVDAKLRAASVAPQPTNQTCTQELGTPVWVALRYADGSRATVAIKPYGCWEIVQSRDALSDDPTRRPVPLPDRSILGPGWD